MHVACNILKECVKSNATILHRINHWHPQLRWPENFTVTRETEKERPAGREKVTACDGNLICCVHLYLSKFPRNTDGPAQSITSNEKCLHTPSPEMAECKNVKMAQDSLPGDDMAVHSVFLQAEVHAASLKWLIIPRIVPQVEHVNQQENDFCCKPPSLTIMSASLLA